MVWFWKRRLRGSRFFPQLARQGIGALHALVGQEWRASLLGALGQEGTFTPTVKRGFERRHHNSKRPFVDVPSGQPKAEGDHHPPMANRCATIIGSRDGQNRQPSTGTSP